MRIYECGFWSFGSLREKIVGHGVVLRRTGDSRRGIPNSVAMKPIK